MTLSETANERLKDIRELEPTSNSELRDRWDMDSGKEVASYLREELSEYVYRDDESRIRTADDASDGTGESSISISGSQNSEQHGTSESEAHNEGNTSSDTAATPRDGTQHGNEVVMTDEEFEQSIEAAREAGYEDGYRDGQESIENDGVSNEELSQIYQDGYDEGYDDAKQESGETGLPTISLPCGHEEIDPAEFLRDHQVRLGCEYCGEWFEGTLLD